MLLRLEWGLLLFCTALAVAAVAAAAIGAPAAARVGKVGVECGVGVVGAVV